METRHDLEHTTERLTEGLRCSWKWGQCFEISPFVGGIAVKLHYGESSYLDGLML